MAVGTYTGNSTDNRSITGVGFRPGVRDRQGRLRRRRLRRAQADGHRPYHGHQPGDDPHLANEPDKIQALEIDGFQLGLDSRVNRNPDTYYWAAFADDTATRRLLLRGDSRRRRRTSIRHALDHDPAGVTTFSVAAAEQGRGGRRDRYGGVNRYYISGRVSRSFSTQNRRQPAAPPRPTSPRSPRIGHPDLPGLRQPHHGRRELLDASHLNTATWSLATSSSTGPATTMRRWTTGPMHHRRLHDGADNYIRVFTPIARAREVSESAAQRARHGRGSSLRPTSSSDSIEVETSVRIEGLGRRQHTAPDAGGVWVETLATTPRAATTSRTTSSRRDRQPSPGPTCSRGRPGSGTTSFRKREQLVGSRPGWGRPAPTGSSTSTTTPSSTPTVTASVTGQRNNASSTNNVSTPAFTELLLRRRGRHAELQRLLRRAAPRGPEAGASRQERLRDLLQEHDRGQPRTST